VDASIKFFDKVSQ